MHRCDAFLFKQGDDEILVGFDALAGRRGLAQAAMQPGEHVECPFGLVAGQPRGGRRSASTTRSRRAR